MRCDGMESNLVCIDKSNFLDTENIISPYQYLIDNRNNDYNNLSSLYDHLEAIRLTDSEICNIIIDKKVLLNGKFQEREDALLNLECTYWVKLLEDSKIRDLMPYVEYTKLLNIFKTRNKEKYIPFTEKSVTGFIENLINSKPILFANKVNSIICNLDYDFKNNNGSMIPALMILKTNYSTFPSWENCQKIDDLRYSIRQILQLDLKFNKTQNVFQENYDNEWISVDDDYLRIKRFKNANAHVLLSEEIYDKLNEVVSLVNKNIIPQNCKNIRKKTYKREE